MVLAKVGVSTRHSIKRLYNLRSIRAYRATEWIKLVMEYKRMRWSPEPPNPLSHTDWKTARDHYATKGCDNEWEASKRCVDKYFKYDSLKQSWMDPWVREHKRNNTLGGQLQ